MEYVQGENIQLKVLFVQKDSSKQQILDELDTETYDLVIITAVAKDWWQRCFATKSVEPVLIAELGHA